MHDIFGQGRRLGWAMRVDSVGQDDFIDNGGTRAGPRTDVKDGIVKSLPHLTIVNFSFVQTCNEILQAVQIGQNRRFFRQIEK